MLPKRNRLVTTREILSAMKTRFQARTKFLHIRIKQSNTQFKVVTIVSKKISKRANKRNLLNRQLHAVFEELKHKSQLPKDVNLVVQVTNKKALDADFSNLKKDLLDGVAKLYFKYSQYTKHPNPKKDQKSHS